MFYFRILGFLYGERGAASGGEPTVFKTESKRESLLTAITADSRKRFAFGNSLLYLCAGAHVLILMIILLYMKDDTTSVEMLGGRRHFFHSGFSSRQTADIKRNVTWYKLIRRKKMLRLCASLCTCLKQLAEVRPVHTCICFQCDELPELKRCFNFLSIFP